MMAVADQAAQNQHYVPKLILRQFLCDAKREQVWAFDKKAGKSFTTTIRNIMAERRFNDFRYGEQDYSFEPVAQQLEDMIVPTYRRIVEEKRLNRTAYERESLANLIAFQLLRTKSHRDGFSQIGDLIRQRFRSDEMTDREADDIFPTPDDDTLKYYHLDDMVRSIIEFSAHLNDKIFALFTPPDGSTFLIGDNPVTLRNDAPKDALRGNVGLAVEGIQIYLPLAADLMLCAFCPSVVRDIDGAAATFGRLVRDEGVRRALAGASPSLVRDFIEKVTATNSHSQTAAHVEAGTPMLATLADMEVFNSLQLFYAHRFLVSRDGDFKLARTLIKSHPEWAEGWKFTAA